MKIASFNVNSIRARMNIVLEWLDKNQPDILCVQETKVQDDDFPIGAFDGTEYRCVFKGQKSYNGVAIFSKHEITKVKCGLDDEPKDESRLIKAEINGVNIVNTYIPQGYSAESEKFEYKLEWFGRLLRFFEENFQPGEPVIWVGDLNVAPEKIDVYDHANLSGHVCFHPQVRKALEKVVRWGFVDVFRMHCHKSGEYTFWDYRRKDSFERNIGWRLDHIMATESLAEKCTNCYTDKRIRLTVRPSDHVPIIAEFDL
jgi:exodeoxyribonuclease-3